MLKIRIGLILRWVGFAADWAGLTSRWTLKRVQGDGVGGWIGKGSPRSPLQTPACTSASRCRIRPQFVDGLRHRASRLAGFEAQIGERGHCVAGVTTAHCRSNQPSAAANACQHAQTLSLQFVDDPAGEFRPHAVCPRDHCRVTAADGERQICRFNRGEIWRARPCRRRPATPVSNSGTSRRSSLRGKADKAHIVFADLHFGENRGKIVCFAQMPPMSARLPAPDNRRR